MHRNSSKRALIISIIVILLSGELEENRTVGSRDNPHSSNIVPWNEWNGKSNSCIVVCVCTEIVNVLKF